MAVRRRRRDQTPRGGKFDRRKSPLSRIRSHAIEGVIDHKSRSRGSESGSDFAHSSVIIDMKGSKGRRGDERVPCERLVAAHHHDGCGTIGRMVCDEGRKTAKVAVAAKAERGVQD